MISSAVKPKVRSAPAFQLTISPSESEHARSRSRARRRAACAPSIFRLPEPFRLILELGVVIAPDDAAVGLLQLDLCMSRICLTGRARTARAAIAGGVRMAHRRTAAARWRRHGSRDRPPGSRQCDCHAVGVGIHGDPIDEGMERARRRFELPQQVTALPFVDRAGADDDAQRRPSGIVGEAVSPPRPAAVCRTARRCLVDGRCQPGNVAVVEVRDSSPGRAEGAAAQHDQIVLVLKRQCRPSERPSEPPVPCCVSLTEIRQTLYSLSCKPRTVSSAISDVPD